MILLQSTMASLLRAIRKDAGFTQIELGAILGLTSGGMSHIESGKRETTTKVLLAWIAACKHELRVVRPDREPPVLDVSRLSEHDRHLFAAMVDRWETLGDLQREMFRVQFDQVRRVSPSARQDGVKYDMG
jgi:transcriptional regulator with XRE-family HTH domain